MPFRSLISLWGRMGYTFRRIDKSDQRQTFLSDVDRKLGYYLEEEANLNIKKIRGHTMLPYIRLVVLYQQVVHCEKLGIRGLYRRVLYQALGTFVKSTWERKGY